MAEITILEPRNSLPDPEHDPGPRHGFRAAAGRFVRTVGKIVGSLALGVGLAIGGYCIAASSASILTSSDKALVQLIAAEPPAAAVDPFAPRRKDATPAAAPEETPYGKRTEALLSFSLGLIMALMSLAGFAGCWFETAEAFDAIRRRSHRQ
jgi:hypothetical protein